VDQKVSKVAQNGRHHQTQVYYDDSPETDSSQATRSFIEQMTPKPLFIGGGCVSESHAADLSHCNQPSPTERQNAILSTQRVRCLETRNLDEADSSCMFIKLLSSEPCFVFSSGGGVRALTALRPDSVSISRYLGLMLRCQMRQVADQVDLPDRPSARQ
jgi:hypothetical protein